MEKTKLKNLLKCGILLFGISALLFNCQKEDDILNTDTFQTETYKTVSLNQVHKLKPIIENLKKVRTNNSNVSLRTSEDTFLGLDNVITNEIIQITDANNVSTYTFSLNTDFENSGFIENLHIIETEQDYIAYIMKYEPNENWFLDANNYTPEGDLVLNLQTFQGHKTKYTIDKEVIWSTIPPANGRGAWVEVCSISLIESCSFGNKIHPRGAGCGGPFSTQSQETCSTVYASGGFGNGDNSSNNPDGDDGTTNGGGYAYNDNCEEVTGTLIQNSQPISGMNVGCTTNEDTAVSQPLGKKTQCNKIKAFVTNIDTTYISKVRNLKNLDGLPYESAVTMRVDGTIAEYDGSANNTKVNVPQDPNSDYTAISHVHNEHIDVDGILKPTYSVFSLSDLAEIATIYKKDKIRSSKFVAFLSTADDTHYALTINNQTKFSDFFRYLDMRNTSLTEEEQNAGLDKFIEITDITDKYFLSD